VLSSIQESSFGFSVRNHRILFEDVLLLNLNDLICIDVMSLENLEKLKMENLKSIGRILCSLLGMNPEQTDAVYRSGSRREAEEIIRNSSLFQQYGLPAESAVMDQLSAAVCKTAGFDGSKHSSLLQLNQHLMMLEALLLSCQSGISFKRGFGLEIADKQKNRTNQVHEAFQYLLYKRPLYLWQKEKDTQLYEVILAGFGPDMQTFLDVLLETAQSMNQKPAVQIWETEALIKEKEAYLKARPALSQFFLIEGMEDQLNGNPEDAYGSICFHSFPNGPMSEAAAQMIGRTPNVRYICIGLENEEENEQLAKQFSQLPQGQNVSVNVQSIQSKKDFENIHYVNLEENIRDQNEFQELERMAFNAHLVWSGTLNTDLKRKREQFDEEYYHSACLSSVLSIQYKLHMLGISLENGAAKAAVEFQKLMKDQDDLKKELTCIEH
ncbi:MAG: hypothetical protein HUJ54_14765, partial [Erysipelotrichaceae bacterium]|nr:hypothetical protein [Erysipelotrichaceae bacterium]